MKQNSLSRKVKQHLDANDVHYHECECEGGSGGFVIPFAAPNCRAFCTVHVHEEERRLAVSVTHGLNVFPNRLLEACEFVVRATLGQIFGGFWINPDSGAIGFAAAVVLADMEPTDEFIGTLIRDSVHTYHTYFPALCQVLYAGVSPKKALDDLNGPSSDEVAQSLAKLFEESMDIAPETVAEDQAADELELPETKHPDDPQSSSSDNKQESQTPADPGRSGNTTQLPNIEVKATPEEIEDVLKSLRAQRAKQKRSRRGKKDDSA